MSSQWGKIKANLVSDLANTPLQDKLEDMAGLVCDAVVVGETSYSSCYYFDYFYYDFNFYR